MTDRPEASESAPAGATESNGLYPSLPNIERYDVYVPKRATEQRLQTAAEFHPGGRPESTQSEASAAGGHVTARAQMLILEEQKQELLSINEKWAKEYRTMAQYYKQKVRDLKSVLQQSRGPVEEGPLDQEDLQVTFYRKLRFNEADDDKGTEDADAEEVRELLAQNRALVRRGQHQHQEIRRLNEALKQAMQMFQPLSGSEPLQELWKHQAEVYKEDFLKERKDREKLKSKYLDLKEKFLAVHSELGVLKSQLAWMPLPPMPSCSCTNRDRCSDWNVRTIRQPHAQSQRRCTGANQQ